MSSLPSVALVNKSADPLSTSRFIDSGRGVSGESCASYLDFPTTAAALTIFPVITPLSLRGLMNSLLTVRCSSGVTSGGLHPQSRGHMCFQQQSIVSSGVCTSSMRVIKKAAAHHRTVSANGLMTVKEKP